jgi:hypothetical protein
MYELEISDKTLLGTVMDKMRKRGWSLVTEGIEIKQQLIEGDKVHIEGSIAVYPFKNGIRQPQSVYKAELNEVASEICWFIESEESS